MVHGGDMLIRGVVKVSRAEGNGPFNIAPKLLSI